MDQEERLKQQQLAAKLVTKFKYFAKVCLRIITKKGVIVPFELNSAQEKLHSFLEDQLKRKGQIRTIIVKGRQMGGSTYVQGRFYHKLWASKNPLSAFILTHDGDATSKIFGMAKNLYEFHPQELAKPDNKANNASQLKFAHNGCSYSVGTAGAKELGRGSTLQMFHGSEVAFWPNAENHIASIFQTMADSPGTEMILESTANGMGNMFHKMVMASQRGEGDFEVIFMPWFWDDGYQTDCPGDWEPTEEWHEYGKVNRLQWPQLYWAYKKNMAMANALGESIDEPCWKFKQEYPANLTEAFQSSGAKSFISAARVSMARAQEGVVGRGPIILGVDPARVGEEGAWNDDGNRKGDFVGVIDRQGNVMGSRICELISPEGSIVTVAQKIGAIINKVQPDSVHIDMGGVGAGVYDNLVNMGFGHRLVPVDFGGKPVGMSATGGHSYRNRRAEMWDNMRNWFMSDEPVKMVNNDLLHNDITSPIMGQGNATFTDHNGVMILEPKASIKKRLGHSPDLGDAAALTFAVPHDFLMNVQTTAPRVINRKSRYTGY